MSDQKPTELQPISTPLTSFTEQVGQHVVTALQQEDTVAVISAIVPGIGHGGDRIVSMPVGPAMMAQIDALLQGAHQIPQEEFEEKCIGFQCQIPGVDDTA